MIKLLEDGNIDLNVLEISDVIDISLLQNFQDNFAIGLNCASVTVDRNGNPITKPSSYTRFCNNYINQSSIGRQRCAESHHRMGLEATRTKRPYIGQCHAGLIDFAAPIVIDNQYIGTVLGGQILTQAPKQELYRKVANDITINENALMDAVNQVTITKMATNTRILGVNSSIEAAHAGQAGKGFAVVAREIQALSETSKEIANEIMKFTSQIKTSIDSTIDHSKATLHTTEIQTKEVSEVAASVQQIVHLAKELDTILKATS